jgi:hypothetical protein
MLGFMRRFDWRRSEGHLLLLTKFATPKTPMEVLACADWRSILNESPERAIKRFLDDGMLASIGEPNPRATPVTATIQCSSEGQSIAREYAATLAAEKAKVELEVLGLLTAGQFRAASVRVATFEAEQMIPRASGEDWEHHSPLRDILILNTIFTKTPKVLERLGESSLEPLRLATGMMYLWGAESPGAWVPAGFQTGVELDPGTVARMLRYYAAQQAALVQYRQMGFVKAVRIEPRNDANTCEACRLLGTRTFRLGEVPDLPYEGCTSPLGCRCAMVTVVDEP